jgi:dUTP pyrophosphatase
MTDSANSVQLQVVVEPGVKPPRYAHDWDAGFDLCVKEDVDVTPDATAFVGSGLRMAIPEGFYGKVVMRSGFSTKNNVVLANGEGIIDSTYRGEVMLPLISMAGNVHIPAGTRVAQMVIERIPKVHIEYVESLDSTERGEGGFGSTGA